MTNRAAPPTLDAGLNRLAAAFRGMTAQADEVNCECHWGSAEELASLKVPDVELELDLIHRTWWAPDWRDHASVLRRILPPLAAALANGDVPDYDLADIGRSIARGNWQQWPTEQSTAVFDFLHAWWAHCLTAADPPAQPYDALALCAEAAGTVGPWLSSWEATRHPLADQRLAEALRHWDSELLGDVLPWGDPGYDDDQCRDLTTWLLRHAPARLGTHGDPAHLRNVLRLLAIPSPTRYDDPHWPFPAYNLTAEW